VHYTFGEYGGAPRCPVALALAVGAAAAQAQDSWAGGVADVEQSRDLAAIQGTARRASAGDLAGFQWDGHRVVQRLEVQNGRPKKRPRAAVCAMALCHLRWGQLQQSWPGATAVAEP